MMRASQVGWLRACGLGAGALTVLGVLSASSWSQTSPKGQAPAKGQAAKKEAKAAPKEEIAPDRTAAEVFRDPRNRPLMKNSFDALFRRETATQKEADQMRAMAERGPANKAQVATFVKAQVRELTDHANIEAMLDPEGKSADFLKLEEAATRLAVPLEAANLRKNVAFRKAFVQEMLAPGVGDAVLKNHLYARLQFLIVLAGSGEPAALDTFAAVLADKEQPAILKLEAARGITKVVSGGSKADTVDSSTRIKVAKSLSDFLRNEPETVRPALDRALEALGSLREDSFDPGRNDLEFLTTAAMYLAKADAVELRARAAWAVGMMRLNPAARLNLPLLVAHSGQVAADQAEEILGDYLVSAEGQDVNAPVRYWVHRLVTEVGMGLKGDPDVSESGLLFAANRAIKGDELRKISDIEERVRALCKTADGLAKAAGALRAQEKANLVKDLGELRAALNAKPAIADPKLTPGGPELPLRSAAAAEEPAAPAARPAAR
ncbi:MAG: hypothetical protein U0800_07110 [Isosphaeraceae bacterium]